MIEATLVVVTNTTKATAVTSSWKWVAVLVGLGALALLYVLGGIFAGAWNPWKLVEGADGRASTSKFQWALWIVVVIFAYCVLWVLRARQGDYSAIRQVPVNVLTVLGFSTGTAIAAKAITNGYIQTGRVAKPAAAQSARRITPRPTPASSSSTAGGAQGGVLTDDSGMPELAKIQMIGFTLVSLGIFLTAVAHQVASTPVITSLPDIDSSLLVLMGISQGGYLGKKLVTFGTPILYQANPSEAATGTAVTLTGANLVSPPPGLPAPPGGQLVMNNVQVPTTAWSNSALSFDVPGTNPLGGGEWVKGERAQLFVLVNGQTSNAVTLTITGPPS